MRQILIMNNIADQQFKPFFEKVFFTVGVKTIWNTYENLNSGKPAMDEFKREIQASNALFLILNREVQSLSKIEDCVFGESSLTEGKDVWVFEHCENLKRISLRVPHLKHYVAFYITNTWTDYVVKLAEAFEGNKAAPDSLPETKLESISRSKVNSLFDETTGLALFDYSTSRPIGMKTTCSHCAATYDIHLPADMKIIRCAVCGSFCEIKPIVSTPNSFTESPQALASRI